VYELEAGSAAATQQQQQQSGTLPVGLTRLGVCAVDVASGHVMLGEFIDDEVGVVVGQIQVYV
jgi:hypothetical protein